MSQTGHVASAVSAEKSNSETPNAENTYTVGMNDLPLHCPLPGASLWNSHPRVYLAIEDTGSAKCSYCGAQFTLDRSA